MQPRLLARSVDRGRACGQEEREAMDEESTCPHLNWGGESLHSSFLDGDGKAEVACDDCGKEGTVTMTVSWEQPE